MKLFKAIILLILLATALSVSAQDDFDNHFSLQECLDYAMENNENVIISNLEIESSKAKTGEYLSTGYPQVDASIAVNKNFILRKAFLPKEFVDPTAPPGEFVEIAFGTPYDGDVGLSVSQMVFSGAYFVGLKASKTYQDLSRKDYIKSKIDVAEAVTKGYYTVLVNQMLLETIVSNYQRLDSLVRETSIMQENGFVELLDLNRTKVEFNNIKTQKINSERSVEISKSLLKFQMGMPVGYELTITDKLSDLNFNLEEALLTSSNFEDRIEYSILETNKQLTEYDMKYNKSLYLPNIDLFFGWGMNSGVSELGKLLEINNRSVWPTYQLVGLSMKVPIFDGLYKAKKIQQNKIKLRQLDYQGQMLENSINMEVGQTRKRLNMSLTELRSQDENKKLAESVYNQTKIKYQEGVGTNLEVIEADNSYKQAQSNYFNALYDAMIAHVEYQKALGIIKID